MTDDLPDWFRTPEQALLFGILADQYEAGTALEYGCLNLKRAEDERVWGVFGPDWEYLDTMHVSGITTLELRQHLQQLDEWQQSDDGGGAGDSPEGVGFQ
jgi:hypothetical protein